MISKSKRKKRCVPRGWILRKIGDIAETGSGGTPLSTKKEYYKNGKIPWINSGEINRWQINKPEKYITELGMNSSSAKLFPKKTVLIAMYGATAGKASILNIEATCNQAICGILPNKDFCPEFLKYSLDFIYDYLVNLSSGSARDNLSQEGIRDLLIPFPDLRTQEQISEILLALDSKIEINNQINTHLEDISKTIFDYWFLQFNFPDKNGNPYKSTGGKLSWNNDLKCEIPKDWIVIKLADWIDTNKNGDWGCEEETEINSLKVNCIRGADINGLNGLEELNPPVRFINSNNTNKILSSHDLIIEISGGSPVQSTGRLAYITDTTIKRFENPLICSNFCKAISLKDKKLLYNFAFLWTKLYDNGAFFGHEGKTSGIKNLLFDSFVNSYWTYLPTGDVVDKFYDIMQIIQEKKQINLNENNHLVELRDWLLPMLMNGQIRVN